MSSSTAALAAPGVGIIGTGAYLPAGIITNEEVCAGAGVTEEWILRKTGIRTRHRASAEQATSDLAYEAATQALEDAGLRPDQISLIIVSTITPDGLGPSTAAGVAGRLGCEIATAAFDLNAACSGFLYSLAVAKQFLQANGGYGLVIGADIYTKFVNPKDKHIAVLWGDGAGAVVLGPTEPGTGLLETKLFCDGTRWHLAGLEGGGSRNPASHETVDAGMHFMKMDGRGITEALTTLVPPAVGSFLEETGTRPEDVAHLVPHQGNANLVSGLPTMLGLQKSRLHLTADKYGNTGSASIPITLHEARREHAFQPGELLLTAAFGIGFTLAFGLIRWPELSTSSERTSA